MFPNEHVVESMGAASLSSHLASNKFCTQPNEQDREWRNFKPDQAKCSRPYQPQRLIRRSLHPTILGKRRSNYSEKQILPTPLWLAPCFPTCIRGQIHLAEGGTAWRSLWFMYNQGWTKYFQKWLQLETKNASTHMRLIASAMTIWKEKVFKYKVQIWRVYLIIVKFSFFK